MKQEYRCNFLFDPNEIIVGIDLRVEARKFIAIKVTEALVSARGDAEKAALLLRVPIATVYRVCRTWGIDREKIREDTEIKINLSDIYRV